MKKLKNNMGKKSIAFLLAITMVFSVSGIASASQLVKAPSGDQASWGFEKLGVETAWAKGYTGSGVKIAVLDTGVAPHSDLNIAGGVSFVSYTTSYADDNGHGTHVAGILAAKRDGVGLVGMVPDAQVYAVKVMNAQAQGNTADLVSGINWAISNHMDIINISLGTTLSNPTVANAINNAIAAGIIVVTSAGNAGTADGTGNTLSFPATMDPVISVVAVDENLNRASFSSTGDQVDFSAPGVNIASTSYTGGYEARNGTSMAAPFITGEIAILKQAFPNATSTDIQTMLQKASQDLGVAGHDPLYGYGFPSLDRVAGIGYTPVDPVQLQDATNAVTLAVKYKSSVYTNRAVDKVNALPDSPEKSALEANLNAIGVILTSQVPVSSSVAETTSATTSTPASQSTVDPAALSKATTAVQLAETYRASIYINKANELVNALPDCPEKAALVARMSIVVPK